MRALDYRVLLHATQSALEGEEALSGTKSEESAGISFSLKWSGGIERLGRPNPVRSSNSCGAPHL